MKTKINYCPRCNSKLDAYSPVDKDNFKIPSPGDISFCVYCGELLIFSKDMLLRVPTKTEFLFIKNDPELMEYWEFIRQNLIYL